jgi:hypothetical protein
LAKAEKLKPLEIELRRLEDLSQEIVNDFNYMKVREEEMRSTNGTFNAVHGHFVLIKFFYFYLFKNQQTPRFFISAYLACAACWAWPFGKSSI